MKVVAILQNMWFKNPARVRQIFELNPEDRNSLIGSYLFMGCLTGRRIQKAFGEEWCESIAWEEASPNIGGKSSSTFPAEPEHIHRFLLAEKPDVVLTFGGIAKRGLEAALALFDGEGDSYFMIISGPHPAARGAEVVPGLSAMRVALDTYRIRESVSEPLRPQIDVLIEAVSPGSMQMFANR